MFTLFYRMIMRKDCILALFFTFILVGCVSEQIEILQNRTFAEVQQIAVKKKQNFCIVLLDTTDLTSKIYMERLNHESLEAVFNIMDMNLHQNEWYAQWLYSNSTPITCIFTPVGELIDIIPGASRKCFYCMEQVIKDSKMCMDLNYYNSFSLEKETLIPLLNDVFQCNRELQQGNDISEQIDVLSNVISYPYVLYLKMENLAKHDKFELAQLVATQLLGLDLEDVWEQEIYLDLLIAAKKMLDSDYDVRLEPQLECDKVIELDNCEIGKPKLFEIKVMNSGVTTLEIQEIQLSCSCVTLIGDEHYTILPGESQRVKFQFTIDKNEEVEREILLKSNGIYSVHRVKIIAKPSC